MGSPSNELEVLALFGGKQKRKEEIFCLRNAPRLRNHEGIRERRREGEREKRKKKESSN